MDNYGIFEDARKSRVSVNNAAKQILKKGGRLAVEKSREIDWWIVVEYGMPLVMDVISPAIGMAVTKVNPRVAKMTPKLLGKSARYVRKGARYLNAVSRVMAAASL